MSELSEGFEGVILSGGGSSEQRLPIGFEGIILIYNDVEKFIKVVNNRGVPFIGAEVIVQNTDKPAFTGVTNQDGFISGLFDLIGNIPVRIKSGNIYYDTIIDGGNQPITTIFEFKADFI